MKFNKCNWELTEKGNEDPLQDILNPQYLTIFKHTNISLACLTNAGSNFLHA